VCVPPSQTAHQCACARGRKTSRVCVCSYAYVPRVVLSCAARGHYDSCAMLAERPPGGNGGSPMLLLSVSSAAEMCSVRETFIFSARESPCTPFDIEGSGARQARDRSASGRQQTTSRQECPLRPRSSQPCRSVPRQAMA